MPITVLYLDEHGVVEGIAGRHIWDIIRISLEDLNTHAAPGHTFHITHDNRDWQPGDTYYHASTKEEPPVDRTIEQLIEEGLTCNRVNISKQAARIRREADELRRRLDAAAELTVVKTWEADLLKRIKRGDVA